LKNDKLIDIRDYLRKIFFFSNAYVIYRIMLTFLVSVVLDTSFQYLIK